jgi:hypothetical protein
MTLVAVYVSSGSMSSVTGSADYAADIDFPSREYRRPVAKLQSRGFFLVFTIAQGRAWHGCRDEKKTSLIGHRQ